MGVMDGLEPLDDVLRRAINDAYDRGRALGRAEGYDAGFLAAVKAEAAQDDSESQPAAT